MLKYKKQNKQEDVFPKEIKQFYNIQTLSACMCTYHNNVKQ